MSMLLIYPAFAVLVVVVVIVVKVRHPAPAPARGRRKRVGRALAGGAVGRGPVGMMVAGLLSIAPRPLARR
ncbi:Uncharacterised protein [Nocardia otitidiscaviarum]|uniref:Uncharacterized protein n=1 Tax=Nocardia otitidiscaviarum TaxID=1823 RepID=A0A379JLX3_9NOCA|nr:hypothetical protein [Nocardia otitidiscaviarum]SUD49617.1 Uncharacterised protein [Nocardia otitidiscaviarum]